MRLFLDILGCMGWDMMGLPDEMCPIRKRWRAEWEKEKE